MEVQNIPQQTALYQASGSVGIGVTNPSAKLQIESSGTVVPLAVNTSGTGNLMSLLQGGVAKFTVGNTGGLNI